MDLVINSSDFNNQQFHSLMKNFKKSKPHQLLDERVKYVSHLKRIENLMSDQSPTIKRNKKERLNLLNMMHSSRKIHQNSIRYQFSLRTQKQNQFLNSNFNHVKSVVKDLNKSRQKEQTSPNDTKKDKNHKYIQQTHQFEENYRTGKQNSDIALNNILSSTAHNSKYNKNKASLNTSPNKPKLLPLKVRLQKQNIQQENQRLVDRLLRVKPQISFPVTQRSKLKYKVKSKKQHYNLIFSKRCKDKQDKINDFTTQTSRKCEYDYWKDALIKTDMLKIFQNSKLNQTISQKYKIILKLYKDKKKFKIQNKSQQTSSQNHSGQQSINDSIMYDTQNSIGNNLKVKKVFICFDQSFFKAAKISKIQRKQIYSIEVRYGQNYVARTQPSILQDLIESEIILLIPILTSANKQNSGTYFKENQQISLRFFKNLDNKSILKGYVSLDEREVKQKIQQQANFLKKKTYLTHRTNISLAIGNAKTENSRQLQQIEKQFFFSSGKKSFQSLIVQVHSQVVRRKTRKSRTGVVQMQRQQKKEQQ